MNGESEAEGATAVGIDSRVGWPVGGAIGGAVGAVAFGVLVWLIDPELLVTEIPAIYGLDSAGVVGWGVHLFHGIVLGIVFAFLVTSGPILGILRTDVETEALSEVGLTARVVAAGFVFGLAIWAILPLLVLPLWANLAGTAAEFPAGAPESLLGHLLFGTVLGIVFATTIDVSDRRPETPLEE